jgi:hypothetical protein
MASDNLPHANAKRSSTRRLVLVIGIIFLTAWTLRASLREFDSGDCAHTLSVSMATTNQIDDLWMPVVLKDSATTSTSTEAGMNPKATIAIVATSTTALVFNKTKSRNDHSQSSVPPKVHANHSDDAMTTTLSPADATATNNKTLSKSKEQPRPHPHAGARDADGNWGYVADVTRIRRWMLQR